MEVRELRVGNWFTDCDEESYYRVLDIELTEHGEYFVGIGKNDCIKIDGVYPIPLTPEVLESVLHGLDTNGFELVWTRTKRLEVHMQGSYLTTVDYLHQYQNLYYSLIGHELEIKL